MRAVSGLTGKVARRSGVFRARKFSSSSSTLSSLSYDSRSLPMSSQRVCVPRRWFCTPPKSEEDSSKKTSENDDHFKGYSEEFMGDSGIPKVAYDPTVDAKDMPGFPKFNPRMHRDPSSEEIDETIKPSVRAAVLNEMGRLKLKDKGYERETKPELSEEKKKSLLKAFDHCCEAVEKEEPQLYETMKYLKGASNPQRLAICVLRHLNNELNQVRADSNNAQAAQLRLQWWQANVEHLLDRHGFAKTESGLRPGKIRDAVTGRIRDMTLDEVKNSPKSGRVGEAAFDTPVLRSLAVCIRKYNLNGHWLRNLTKARQSFLHSNTFFTLLDLEEYSENTQGLLLYLSMEILGCAYDKNHTAQLTAASHIAALMTYVSVIRSVPLAAANGFISLPDEVSAEFDVYGGESEILKGNSTPELKKAIEHLSIKAYAHLLQARELNSQVSKQARSLFLCSVGPERYLKYLEKKQFDVFDPNVINYFDMGIGLHATLNYRSRIGWY